MEASEAGIGHMQEPRRSFDFSICRSLRHTFQAQMLSTCFVVYDVFQRFPANPTSRVNSSSRPPTHRNISSTSCSSFSGDHFKDKPLISPIFLTPRRRDRGRVILGFVVVKGVNRNIVEVRVMSPGVVEC